MPGLPLTVVRWPVIAMLRSDGGTSTVTVNVDDGNVEADVVTGRVPSRFW